MIQEESTVQNEEPTKNKKEKEKETTVDSVQEPKEYEEVTPKQTKERSIRKGC